MIRRLWLGSRPGRSVRSDRVCLEVSLFIGLSSSEKAASDQHLLARVKDAWAFHSVGVYKSGLLGSVSGR